MWNGRSSNTVKEPKKLPNKSLAAKANAKPPKPSPANKLLTSTFKLSATKTMPTTTTNTLRLFVTIGTNKSSNFVAVLLTFFISKASKISTRRKALQIPDRLTNNLTAIEITDHAKSGRANKLKPAHQTNAIAIKPSGLNTELSILWNSRWRFNQRCMFIFNSHATVLSAIEPKIITKSNPTHCQYSSKKPPVKNEGNNERRSISVIGCIRWLKAELSVVIITSLAPTLLSTPTCETAALLALA